ncbi:MAG: queuosine precursor transporter [Kiritimatiellae bacterium]|nr:queuosine precursor transporter [Kiritimatiellia bacterium]
MTSLTDKTDAVRISPAIPSIVVLVVGAYVAAQMLSDVASLKIGVLFGWPVDMGTFIYPITFTLRDLVHRTLGKRGAQVTILFAAFANLLMALFFAWAVRVPSDMGWGKGEAFADVFAPIWRIVLASIAAEVISELADTEVYHWFVTRVTRRHAWARVLLSNGVAVPVDNLVFCVGAFGWSMPWSVVWGIFVFNLVLKTGVTLLSLPLIYVVPEGDGPRS